ncbi:MAG: hypothetical protein WKG52_00675 [Variovorax sp.]
MIDGMVAEIIAPLVDIDGNQVPIEQRFHPDFVASLTVYDPANPPPPPPAPPGPTHAQLVERAKADTRIQRQPIIVVLDGLQSSALALGNAPRALAIETAKQGLRDITDTDLSAAVTYEDMRLKVKAAYVGLAKALPVDVRLAFSEALK